jgi:hypothetical protein
MSTAQIIYNQSLPVNILPFIWAVGAELPVPQPAAAQPLRSVPRNMAVYRRYTEAMLRRYLRMAMEAGKVPSLLGQEMFRAKVTCYRIANFDDAVMADLCVLKTQMKEIVGNGQPGRLAQVESRVRDHERAVQRLRGMAAAFGGILTFAHVAIDLFVGRR